MQQQNARIKIESILASRCTAASSSTMQCKICRPELNEHSPNILLYACIYPCITQDREAQSKARYDSIKADGEVIHSLVKENLGYFMVRQ